VSSLKCDVAVGDDAEADGGEPLRFTATNPAASVAATVTLGGHLVDVALSPRVTQMTEAELGEEILVIAAVAVAQSKSAQHVVIAGFMAELGHDSAATRDFLEVQVGLPSPASVLAATAELFASRYTDEL
jgi:hypothetical protein